MAKILKKVFCLCRHRRSGRYEGHIFGTIVADERDKLTKEEGRVLIFCLPLFHVCAEVMRGRKGSSILFGAQYCISIYIFQPCDLEVALLTGGRFSGGSHGYVSGTFVHKQRRRYRKLNLFLLILKNDVDRLMEQ